MANIKISELNLLTEKSYNDIIPIVDTSADETKKITIEDLVDNNVSLLAVTDIAPSECVIGDKYYNTITNKIYTATDTDTWSETGEEPIEGIFYIVFEDQTSYAYDGTELVSVGGGAGGGAYIGTEEPTDENVNFWINPDEVTNTQQQEELYSTSEIRIGTWIDGKPLYRKVLVDTVPTITSSGTLQVKDISMPSNVDTTTLRIKEAHLLNSGRLIPSLFYLNDTLNYFIKVYPSGNFKIRIASNNASYSENAIYIIIEYTKTTD